MFLFRRQQLVFRPCTTFIHSTTTLRHGGHHHHALSHNPNSKNVDDGLKITGLGMLSNVALTIGKGYAGIQYNSAALLADAAHSLSDLVSDIVTLYTVKKSNETPTKLYPHGFGKYDALGGLSVSAFLVSASTGIAWHSIELIQKLSENGDANITLLHSNVLYAAAAVVVIKEALFRVTLKIGKRANSAVLIANAWHHRSDVTSSIVALGGVFGAHIGFPWLDPLGGIIVAGMIMKTAIETGTGSLYNLMDRANLKMITKLKTSLLDVHQIDDVRIRGAGNHYIIEIFAELPNDLTLDKYFELQTKLAIGAKSAMPTVKEVILCPKKISGNNKS